MRIMPLNFQLIAHVLSLAKKRPSEGVECLKEINQGRGGVNLHYFSAVLQIQHFTRSKFIKTSPTFIIVFMKVIVRFSATYPLNNKKISCFEQNYYYSLFISSVLFFSKGRNISLTNRIDFQSYLN